MNYIKITVLGEDSVLDYTYKHELANEFALSNDGWLHFYDAAAEVVVVMLISNRDSLLGNLETSIYEPPSPVIEQPLAVLEEITTPLDSAILATLLKETDTKSIIELKKAGIL